MQVPEQDETYEEDSFVVNGSEVEDDFSGASDEEEEAGVEIIPENSYVNGRRQYATRRRVHLRQTRTAGETRSLPSKKTKRSRIVRVEDSSDEEVEKKRKTPNTEKAPLSDGVAERVFNASLLCCLPKSGSTQTSGQRSMKEAVQEKDRRRFSNQVLLSDFQEPASTSCIKTQVGF